MKRDVLNRKSRSIDNISKTHLSIGLTVYMEVTPLEGQTDTLGVITPVPPTFTPSLCRILQSADGSGENDMMPAKTHTTVFAYIIFR